VVEVIPVLSLLWVPDILPKCFSEQNTHQESNCQTIFLYSEEQNNWQTITSQKFRRGQKFRLTPDYTDVFCIWIGSVLQIVSKTQKQHKIWTEWMEKICGIFVAEKLSTPNYLDFLWTWALLFKNFRTECLDLDLVKKIQDWTWIAKYNDPLPFGLLH